MSIEETKAKLQKEREDRLMSAVKLAADQRNVDTEFILLRVMTHAEKHGVTPEAALDRLFQVNPDRIEADRRGKEIMDAAKAYKSPTVSFQAGGQHDPATLKGMREAEEKSKQLKDSFMAHSGAAPDHE